MFQYVIKRVLLFIPTLIIITVITFLVCRLAPGDPTEMRVGQTSEGIAAETLINQQAKDYYKKKVRIGQTNLPAIPYLDEEYDF